MARVIYVGPYGALSVAGIEARHGEVVELPDELVHGTPPSGDDPGTSGLLALTDIWAPAPTEPAPSRKRAAADPDPADPKE